MLLQQLVADGKFFMEAELERRFLRCSRCEQRGGHQQPVGPHEGNPDFQELSSNAAASVLGFDGKPMRVQEVNHIVVIVDVEEVVNVGEGLPHPHELFVFALKICTKINLVLYLDENKFHLETRIDPLCLHTQCVHAHQFVSSFFEAPDS